MEVEEVRKYIFKVVLIELKNGFKYTGTIPNFIGSSFEIMDKFGHRVSIDSDMISLIYEKEEQPPNRGEDDGR